MCGIAGFLRPSGVSRDAYPALAAMTASVAHRGPDSSGVWMDEPAGIALGHRRLAVLDPSEMGRQPMASASGRYHLTHNGEVYNFATLRQELAGDGASFRGNSDTEVMLAAFEAWGVPASVRRFSGMFAFALWDAAERTLYLVRDRLGEKPLYFGWHGDTLLFGSELRALRAFPGWTSSIDRGALALYLRHGYVPAPYTILEGVEKVRPGTMRILRAGQSGGVLAEDQYWSARAVASSGIATAQPAHDEALLGEAETILRKAVTQAMAADVPLGAFLSGGIDSSLVVALMQAQSAQPVRTFTIGFHESGLDEASHARLVSKHLGTAHTEVYLTPKELLDTIPAMASVYDEPFGDSSQIPTTLLARVARREVTVSLSGDGGDELFGGYDRYRRAARLSRALRLLPGVLRRPAAATVAIGARRWIRSGRGPGSMHRVPRIAALAGSATRTEFYRQFVSACNDPTAVVLGSGDLPSVFSGAGAGLPGQSQLAHMMFLDLVSYLPDDILVKVDRATMSVGLESRAPFLDHDVVAFAWRLPRAAKMRRGQGKWILRELLRRYVPGPIAERTKQGFAAPIGAWLRGPLRDWAADLLAPERIGRAGLLDAQIVSSMHGASLRGVRQWDTVLWALLMFEAWRGDQLMAPRPAPS